MNAGRVQPSKRAGRYVFGKSPDGTRGGDVTIRPGGQVYFLGSETWTNNWYLAGTGVSDGFGAIRFDQNPTLSGTITLVADALIGTNNGGGGANGTLSGKVTGPGALMRTNNSPGILTVSSPTNDYTGGTIITNGVLQFNSGSTAANTPSAWAPMRPERRARTCG